MLDAIANAFSGTWPFALGLYLLVGLAVLRPTGSIGSRFMSALGWPLELTQRLAGSTGLPYLFLLPNMLVFGLFTFAPMFINIGFSVSDGQSINFDQRIYSFYPVMLSPVVVGFLWTLILKRQGVLSLTLMDWGLISEPIQWLQDPGWTMFWSVFVYTWAHLGFYMLILLAGLQAIPKDLYEAASMDGTSDWRILRKITLPLLMPTILVCTVLSLVKAFQAFEELYAMNVRWQSLVAYIFETSGLRGQPTAFGLGIAATASMLVAGLLMLLSLLQMYLSRNKEKTGS